MQHFNATSSLELCNNTKSCSQGTVSIFSDLNFRRKTTLTTQLISAGQAYDVLMETCTKICLLSSCNDQEKEQFSELIHTIPNGKCIESSIYHATCDYIICKIPTRGEKYLCGCAAGKYVLTLNYIKDCAKAKKWLNEELYEWCNQAAIKGIDESIQNLSRKCKQFSASNGGKLIFSDWKAVICLYDHITRAAYIRLLQAGGAKIIDVSPPFLNDLKYRITHAFVSKESAKDMKLLNRGNFQNILYPEYITQYLVQPHPPALHKYQAFVRSKKSSSMLLRETKPKTGFLTKESHKISTYKGRTGQQTIYDMFPKKRESNANHDLNSGKRICLQKMSSPLLKRLLKSESKTPVFHPTGVSTSHVKRGTSLLDLSPVLIQSKTRVADLEIDKVKSNLFSSFSENGHLFKDALKVNQNIVVDISSDDDDDGGRFFASQKSKPKVTPVEECPGGSEQEVISLLSDKEDSKGIVTKTNALVNEGLTTSINSEYESNAIPEVPSMISESRKHKTKSKQTAFNTQDSFENPFLKDFGNLKGLGAAVSLKSIEPRNKNRKENDNPNLKRNPDEHKHRNSVSDDDIHARHQKAEQPQNIDHARRVGKIKKPLHHVLSAVIKPTTSERVSKSRGKKTAKSRGKKTAKIDALFKNEVVQLNECHFVSPTSIQAYAERQRPEIKTLRHDSVVKSNIDSHSAIQRRSGLRGSAPTTKTSVDTVTTPVNLQVEMNGSGARHKSTECTNNVTLVSACRKHVLCFPARHLKHEERTEFRGSKFLKRAPFTTWMENLIESNNSFQSFQASFEVIKDNLSSFYYPTAKVMLLLFTKIQKEENVMRGIGYTSLLQDVLMHHPTCEISSVFIEAFQQPVEEHDGSLTFTTSAWDYFDAVLSDVLVNLEVAAVERSKYLKLRLQLFEFFVTIMDDELHDLQTQCDKENKSSKDHLEKLHKMVLWRLLWSNSLDCSVNSYVKKILQCTLDLHRKIFTEVEFGHFRQLLLHLVYLVSACMALKDKLTTNLSFSTCCSSLVSTFEILFIETFANHDWPNKLNFLSKLQPNWLSYRVINSMLALMGNSMMSQNGSELLSKPFSIYRITRCYFFLLPSSISVGEESEANTKTSRTESKKMNKTKSKQKTTDLNRRNPKGECPLQIACIKNNRTLVKELLSRGADPNLQDNAGWTALHEVSNFGFEGCLDELLKSPALDVYACGAEGVSALHDAVRNNHLRVAEKLLKRGGKRLFELKTDLNETALDLATTPEMASVLQQYHNKTTFTSFEAEEQTVNVSLNELLYRDIELYAPKQIEVHLRQILLLLRSYTSAEDCRVKVPECEHDIARLEQHIDRLTDRRTLRMRLYINSIKRIFTPM